MDGYSLSNIFTNAPPPRVGILPQMTSPIPPPSLPAREPIAHRTCSWAPAPTPLALFTTGKPLHKCVTYQTPTAKTIWSHVEPIGFAGLTEGYYEAESTPGLWCHKWRPIQFCLIVDDFGVEYVGIKHFNHLLDVLKKFHGVQFNMAGDKFAGINIKWDNANCRCGISMPGYIKNLLIKFKHPHPIKPRLSP